MHGSRRATQRVCMRASFHLHAIHDVCVIVRWLFVFVLSFSCFSPLFISSLPHSTCTLPSTPSPMWTTPRELTTAPSHNEEYCPMAIYHLLTGYEPNVLDDFHSETSAMIFQDESGDIETEPSYSCDAELDDETQRREEPGCPKRVRDHHVVRGRQCSPILEVRPGNRQGWRKRSIFRWNGRQLTLDKTVGSRVWWHTQSSSGRPASDLGWGSSSKTASRSLSTGSPAGRTSPHGDGSMYSQAKVRAGKVLRPPIRALPFVIVVTEKVMREADGPVEMSALTAHFGWNGDRPGVRLESRTGELVRSPKNISDHIQIARVRRTSSWRSICLYPGRNGRCSKIIENSKIIMSRHLDSSTTTQMAEIMVRYGRSSRSSWAKSVQSSFGRTVMGKAIWEHPIEKRLGEGFQLGMLIRTPWKKDYSHLCMWMTRNWLEKNKILFRCGKYSTKKLIWENQHHSLIMYSWDALKDNVK